MHQFTFLKTASVKQGFKEIQKHLLFNFQVEDQDGICNTLSVIIWLQVTRISHFKSLCTLMSA